MITCIATVIVGTSLSADTPTEGIVPMEAGMIAVYATYCNDDAGRSYSMVQGFNGGLELIELTGPSKEEPDLLALAHCATEQAILITGANKWRRYNDIAEIVSDAVATQELVSFAELKNRMYAVSEASVLHDTTKYFCLCSGDQN